MNKNDKQKTELIDTILKLYTEDLEGCTLEELEDVIEFFHYKLQLINDRQSSMEVEHRA